MTITNPQEKQTAIQRIQAIGKELENFGSEFGKLEDDLRSNNEAKNKRLEQLEAEKKKISEQFDGKIIELKGKIKALKESQKDRKKSLEKELNEIKIELGEFEMQTALAS
jgi:DNA repair exonuclease SbcCD ATPase subunit